MSWYGSVMVCIGFREVLVGLDGFSHCGLQWCIVDGFTMIYIIYIYWYRKYPLWYPHALPPTKNIKHRKILWIWLYDPPVTYRKPMVSNGIPTDFNLPKHFGETPVAAMQVFGKFNESWNTSARRCSRIFKTSLMYIYIIELKWRLDKFGEESWCKLKKISKCKWCFPLQKGYIDFFDSRCTNPPVNQSKRVTLNQCLEYLFLNSIENWVVAPFIRFF